MAIAANNNEINKYLLDLFIDSDLYFEYAEKFLTKEQIDNVYVDAIKSLYS